MTVREQENREREKARVARLEDITRRCKGDRWRFDTDGDQTHIIARRSTGRASSSARSMRKPCRMK